MITCTRILEFDAAHRVMNHEGKCKNLHGHRYRVEFTFSADELDEIGRIIDFGKVKAILKKWIDANFDHETILYVQDQEVIKAIEKSTNRKPFELPYNPTSENIAKYLLEKVCPDLFKTSQAKCTKIRVWETPNCYADATL